MYQLPGISRLFKLLRLRLGSMFRLGFSRLSNLLCLRFLRIIRVIDPFGLRFLRLGLRLKRRLGLWLGLRFKLRLVVREPGSGEPDKLLADGEGFGGVHKSRPCDSGRILIGCFGDDVGCEGFLVY